MICIGYHRFERLGASHVHNRDEFLRQQLFCVYDNGYRGPYRHQDLQLARTMWGGKIQFKAPMLFCIGFLLQFLIAGLTGVMMSVAPLRLATRQLLLCRCPFPLRDRGRILFCLFGAFYYWFPENHGKAIERNPGQTPFSALSRSFSPDV